MAATPIPIVGIRGFVRQLDMSGKVRLRSEDGKNGRLLFEGRCFKSLVQTFNDALRLSRPVVVEVDDKGRIVKAEMVTA